MENQKIISKTEAIASAVKTAYIGSVGENGYPYSMDNDKRMKIDNLDIVKRFIADTGGGQVEFKETIGQLERGMETLCAFLTVKKRTEHHQSIYHF